MMERAASLGWGVLGAGLQAQRFAQDLTQVKGARLVAVASRDAARADAAAKAMKADLGVEGREALLALPGVDIVYIATPTRRHRDDCLAALAAGKHVLCEKPLAMSAADGRQIAAAAAKAGRFCMEALWTQFIPAVTRAAALMSEGAIGEPRTLIASFGLPSRAAADPAAMPDGGALLDRGCYPISLALRLLGEISTVEGRPVTGPGGADLEAHALLTFADGRTALIAASLTGLLDNRLFVGGTAGSIGLNDITCPTLLTHTRAAPSSAPEPRQMGPKSRLREAVRRAIRQSALLTRLKSLASDRPQIIPCRGFGFTHEIEEVHACIRAGLAQSPIHPLARSIETLRIIEAIGRGPEGQG